MIKNFKKRLGIAFLCGCIFLQGMPLTVIAAEPDIIEEVNTEESFADDSEDMPVDSEDLPSDDAPETPTDDPEELPPDDTNDGTPADSEALPSDENVDSPSDDAEESPSYDTSVTFPASTEELVWEDVDTSLYQEGAITVETLTKPDAHIYSILSYESQIAEAQQYIYEQLLERAASIDISSF